MKAFASGFFFVSLLVCLGLVLSTVGCGGDNDTPKLSFAEVQAKANAACGTDETVLVDYDGGSWSKLPRFITHCRRPNGNAYTIVNKVPN